MDEIGYNPYGDLCKILQNPESLNELPQLLDRVGQHKVGLNKSIETSIESFNNTKSPLQSQDISKLIQTIQETQTKSKSVQYSIQSITKEISSLDHLKRNLILSMNIFKRLQILSYSISQLNQILRQEYNYKDISNHLSNIKDLLAFFKAYKSIDEINQLYLTIHKIEMKLVDNIFIDFEDCFVNNKEINELSYSCKILEIIDVKYKDKLLTWFYNLQLKEIKTIFSNYDEAGSLDNLNRRFIYFNNTLSKVKSKHINVFPEEWKIDLELSKLFCEITKEDIMDKLSKNSVSSEALLDCLNTTLEFENQLNNIFKTQYFTKIILKVFEPYLNIWIHEQDKFLNTKLIEFYAIPKIPVEFQSTNNFKEFLNILKINSIPNISNSSIELFKVYQKILIQILKLSNGKILIDLANLFNKYLSEYHNRILQPILLSDFREDNQVNTIESIKYLTMILNTGDYIINNLDDLFEKINNVIEPAYKSKFDFDNIKSLYLTVINKSNLKMIELIANDLKFSWRQFENNNWLNMESTNTLSNYMIDLEESLSKKCKIILPLIIRESYAKNFCHKLIDLIIRDFANNLKLIKPLSILNIEQILNDLKHLKEYLIVLPLYASPNFDGKDTSSNEATLQYYGKFVNNQFNKLETILRVLLTPILPVDNFIVSYFQLIGDKSVRNFRKILNLKNITIVEQRKYVENFSLQLAVENNDLPEESPIMAIVDDEFTPTPPPQISSNLPSSLDDTKSPKLKINNLEKNLRELAVNSENNINKFNENFKNFGKFFRKDSLNQTPTPNDD